MKFIISMAILISFSAHATIITEKISCKYSGSTGFMQGQGMQTSKAMTKEECFSLGETAFNTPVTEGMNIINPLKNTVTERVFSTYFKKIKITYFSEGSKVTKTLKRSDVEKVLVSEKVTRVESGFKCWTQGECIAVDDEE